MERSRSQSSKRKFPFTGLQRRVRARKEEEPEIVDDSNPSEEEVSGDDDDDDQEDSQGSGEDDEDGDEQSGSSEDEEDGQSLDPSQISFGALAKAQASMPKRRKNSRKDEEEDDSDDDSDVSEEDTRGGGGFDGKASERKHALQKRSSKHAPMEVTAKRAVTRKREVVSVPKVVARDPRFGPLGTTAYSRHPNPAMEEEATRRNYAFLDKYREDELAELKKEVKKTRDPAAKEKLQRAVMSMQSRKQMLERRDAERAVVAEHRRQEKELVKQGKQPFYLKKSEQKKRVIMDRFAGMKKGQVDKAIERKRKKLASKERREMPMERRER
ncbi:hypothetical protein PG994_008740 [Apiospora phragmitis]|uniref:rRNA biogenesis protein RRP36 n=1 Tax=Apiospora phragmitis TaxID=2905665 RepID=A0ABR1UHB3_9PEZI